MSQQQQLQTEDWVLFLSTVLGSAGMVTTSNPQYMLYGLTVGAASKALLSLGPNWKSLEDWILFSSTFLGAVASQLAKNSEYMLYGLVIGAVGKALPSLPKHRGSVEDWLLFLLPLGTGIVSAIASDPSFAETGLFFGMLGKSLGSVDLYPGSQTAGTSQQPPPSTGLSGNRNWVLWDGCRPLSNPSVKLTAGTDLVANGDWDLQVNAYAPTGTDAYMQFVVAVTDTGEVQWSIENWPVSGDNLFNTCDHHLFQLPSACLPKGYSIRVAMNTDPESSNVTSVDFGVGDATGASVATAHVPLDRTLPLCNGNWSDSYLSQVVGFEPNVVGYNNGVRVGFTLGSSGTLECSALSISASPSIPSCAETKAGTVEDSNLGYSLAVQASPTLVTISATAF